MATSMIMNIYFDNFQMKYYRGELLDETHYYPYGHTIDALSATNANNIPGSRYRYNGKELQRDEFEDATTGEKTGLEWTDYGARMYDAQIGRWHVTDPLAEKYASISPYAYVADNPIKYVDPDGRIIKVAFYSRDYDGRPKLKMSYIYKDGNLYDDKGNIYKGGNNYLTGVRDDLNSLKKNGGELASGVVDYLESSNATHLIGNMSYGHTKKQIDDPYYKWTNLTIKNGRGSRIKYNRKDEAWVGQTNYWRKSDKLVGLIHELVHAFDIDIKKFNNLKDKEQNYRAEGRAVSVENSIGKEQRNNHGENVYNDEELDDFKIELKKDLEKVNVSN